MSTFKTFKDILAWQRAHNLSKAIRVLAFSGTFAQDYKLRNQICSSIGSVLDNIAEGFERDGKGEFVQFLSIAKGSMGEFRSQLQQATDRNHINEAEFQAMDKEAEEIGRMLRGLIDYLRKANIKGHKYK